jgi:ABC-type protease/lipase transport system fused ATPase/permease subunit
MSKRTVVAGALWVVLSVLAFLVDPILGACVLIFGAILVVVVQLSSTWNEHPDYEARELVRAQRRKEKWDRTAGKREKDAARYAAHQARQAEKARGTERERGTGERAS